MTMIPDRTREVQLLRLSEVRRLLAGRGLGERLLRACIAQRLLRPVEGLPLRQRRYRLKDVQSLAAGVVLSRGQVLQYLRGQGLGERQSHGRPAVFDEWRASGLLVPVSGLPGTRARYSFAQVRALIRSTTSETSQP